MKKTETSYDILKRIRVDRGPGNYCEKVFKDKSKYSRKRKHKKEWE